MKKRLFSLGLALSLMLTCFSFTSLAADFEFPVEPDANGVYVEAKGSDYATGMKWDDGSDRTVVDDSLELPLDKTGNIWGYYLTNDSVANMQAGTYKISYYLTLDTVNSNNFKPKPYNGDTHDIPLELLSEYAGQKVINTSVVAFSAGQREYATCWKGGDISGTLDKVIVTTADTNINNLPQSEGYTLIREEEFKKDVDIGEWTPSNPLSSEADVKSFKVGIYDFQIFENKIEAIVPEGVKVVGTPEYTLSDGATITSPQDLTNIDFSNLVTIVVTAGDGTTKTYTAHAWSTARPPVVKVTKVTVKPTSKTLAIGGKVTLTANVTPSNATNKAVTFKSSDTKVATVTKAGKVTAKAAGKATITINSADGSKKTAKITIKVKPAKPTNLKVVKSGKKDIKVTFKKVAGANKYQILMKTGKKAYKKVAETAKTTYTVKKLKKGTKYTFVVKAYNKNAAIYGDASAPKSITR